MFKNSIWIHTLCHRTHVSAQPLNLIYSRSINSYGSRQTRNFFSQTEFPFFNSQTEFPFSNEYIVNKYVAYSARSESLLLGEQLHSIVVKQGFFSNLHITSALVDMYAKCRAMSASLSLFDEMPKRNEFTWGSLIFGYLNADQPEMATFMFRNMLSECVQVSPITVSVCLVGCSQLEDNCLGTQIHALVLKYAFDTNVVISTNLIDLYARCFCLNNAKLVFDHSPFKNVVTWTSMVTAYVQNEQPGEAIRLFRVMKRMGLECNMITYSSLLSSFSSKDHFLHSLQIHCCVIRLGLYSSPYVSSSLVTAYSKCGATLFDFNKLRFYASGKDAVSYTAVLNGYCNMGLIGEAFTCFNEMRENGIDYNVFTFLSLSRLVIDSSTHLQGNGLHAIVIKTGFCSKLSVQNGLVSMYARCGAISESKSIFSDMNNRDVISWNALLTGCAHNGLGSEAVEYFEIMKGSGVKPNGTTFLVVLAACSHSGLIGKGIQCVEYMKREGFIRFLRKEHYSAIVDIFARCGSLREAEAFAREMQVGPTAYRALLSACLVHGNLEIAVNVAKKLLEICPTDSATYVLVSRALARDGHWDGAAHAMDSMCNNKHVTRCPGRSWLSLDIL